MRFPLLSFVHTKEICDTYLHPEEQRYLAAATDKRRIEFSTVRYCVEKALHSYELKRPPMVPDDCGAPQWPKGIVGSMTHRVGYCAAVVAPRCLVPAIGVDAEVNASLPVRVTDKVALKTEKRLVSELRTERPNVAFDRLLFSIKESVYKAWFPLKRRRIAFRDILVEIDSNGTFCSHLLSSGSPWLLFRGVWFSLDDIIVTMAVGDYKRVI
jgi:phosphopantetheinyl transferase